MIKSIKEKIISFIKKPRISKNLMTFLVFLLLSSVLWFLNRLDNEYVTELRYKINLYNFPEEKTLISNSEVTVTVKVSASGYDILSKLNRNKDIDLNVKKYAIKYHLHEDSTKYYILTDIISSQIYSATKSQVQILNITPDSLILRMSKTSSKRVKVKPNIKISYSPMYMKSGTILTIPDSVQISGIIENIKEINYINTEEIIINDLKDSLNKEYKLIVPPNVICIPNKIKLIVPAERYTENSSIIPIEVENLPDSLKMITFPETVKVTYKIGMSKFKEIKNSDFKIVLNFQLFENKLPNKFKVELKKHPQYINSIKIEPEYVDYIIKKN